MHRVRNSHHLRILGCLFLLLVIAHPAAANQPPRAVAAANILPNGTAVSSVRLLVGPTPGDTVNWSVDGNGSSDPDGDLLTYHWQCSDGNGNKCLLQLNGILSANVQALFPAGTYNFTLTVKDPGGASSTDTAQVQVLVDNVAPQVIPPEDASISSTETGGARASDSSELNKFLFVDPYAKDPLGLQFFFTALPPQVSGVNVDANTLFPAGATTTVTFRFADAFGNVGSATADVYAAALRSGDLLVGGLFGPLGQGWGDPGAIYLIRNGQVSTFCASPLVNIFQSDFWDIPFYVTVDSKGRIVFLATVTGRDVGLLRCTAPGQPAEKLGIFPAAATFDPGWPVPFPGRIFQPDPGDGARVRGLHLQRTKKIVIDDAVNGGQPTAVTQESYVFAANPGPIKSLSLRTDSLAWVEDEISPMAVGIGGAHPVDRLPEMFFHSKKENVTLPIPPAGLNVFIPVAKTYVTGSSSSTLRRIHHPLTLDITASISGLGTIQFVFALFGVPLEVGGEVDVNNQGRSFATADDVTTPNGPSGCPPFPPVRNDYPGGTPVTTITNVIYEKDAELVLRSNHGGLPFWMGKVSEALVNLDTMDDLPNHYTWMNPVTTVCFVIPVVNFEPLTSAYHVDPQTGEWFDYHRTAAASDGLYATQPFAGRVVKLNQANKSLTTIANVPGPVGIAAFPPQLGNVQVSALVIRIDSPVDVVVTDTFGRRLGMVNGQAVNEFGSQGFDSGTQSHPRFYVVNHPLPGNYAVQSIGTGSGPFTVHAYSVDTSQRRAEHIFVTGNASPGAVGKHDFTLDTTGALTFNNAAPVADAGFDQTVDANSSGNATVQLDGSASSDPDNDTLTFLWAGPFGILSGAQVNATLPGGVHVLKLTVDDGKGGSAEDTVQITVNAVAPPADTTPPVLTLPANITVEATSPSGAAVNYVASANDAVDGPITPVCSPVSGATFALGTTTVNCTATDAANNQASSFFDVFVTDTTAPVVTPPAGIVLTATEAGGARGSAAAVLAAFLAGGSATDIVDPAPLRLTPQVNSVNADNSTLFPLGTTAVSFRFSDSSGNTGTATATTTVNPSADLAVTTTDSPDPVNVNANLTYTITVTNNGPSAAASASLSDVLPAGVNFVSLTSPAGWTCATPAVGANGTVSCANPSVGSGVSGVFTLVVTPTAAAAASISNTATVSATTSDPNTANNSQTIPTAVNAVADLAITKTDTPDPVSLGSSITYTITVTNNGPSAATGVAVTDAVPANVTFVSATGSGAVTCSQTGGVVTCTVGTLASGASATATVVVRTTALGTVTNTASVTSSVTDLVAGNNSATAATTVTPPPATDFSLALAPVIRDVRAGGTATYVATLTPIPANTSFNTAIGISCFTNLLGATCTAAPGSATPGINPATSTVSVTIPRGSVAPGAPRGPQPPVFQPWLLWLLGMLLAAYCVFSLRHKQRWVMRGVSLAAMLLTLALAVGQSACTKAGEPPIAPYVLTVTATSGSLSHSATATVNVVR